jgi:hypothetical protein
LIIDETRRSTEIAETAMPNPRIPMQLSSIIPMNPMMTGSSRWRRWRRRRGFYSTAVAVAFGLVLIAASPIWAAQTSVTFATPEEAVTALRTAVNSPDSKPLRDLFGPAASEIIASDEVQAKNDQAAFAQAFNVTNRLVHESERKCVLEVGPSSWPFPVPIVQKESRWVFDGAAGKDELVNRRIGQDELSTLKTLRACVEAQREYASEDRDGDDVLEFAPRFTSSPGNKDGLFWEPELDGSLSPLGPLVAAAQAEGYEKLSGEDPAPQPYHGYFLRILTRQGKHAAGGKYDYIINGHMIGGFAFLAWPADYGNSGIMTFLVNQRGKVYQKDLGPRTSRVAKSITEYDPDKSWNLSPD